MFDRDRSILECRATFGDRTVHICVEPEQIQTGAISLLQREATLALNYKASYSLPSVKLDIYGRG